MLGLAPYLRRLGGYTITDFLGARYGGHLPRLVGAGASMAVSFVYLVVQISGVAVTITHLTGFGLDLDDRFGDGAWRLPVLQRGRGRRLTRNRAPGAAATEEERRTSPG